MITMTIGRNRQQSGRVLILVVVIILVLSAFWFIALSSTGNELTVAGGRKSATQQLFDAEAGLAAAIGNLSGLVPSGNLTSAVTQVDIKDPASAPNPADQRVVARIICRPVQDIDAAAAAANRLPVQAHEFDPPAGSGSGVNTGVARRYALTATSGQREVQVGVYRIVPR